MFDRRLIEPAVFLAAFPVNRPEAVSSLQGKSLITLKRGIVV